VLRGELLDVFGTLLAVPFPGQRFFGAPLLTGLQVEGVPFNLLDNVFLLNLTLEATESGLERLALLNINFRQTLTHLLGRFRNFEAAYEPHLMVTF
jgi:hypothetical protein